MPSHQACLPIWEGRYGLATTIGISGSDFIGGQALVLAEAFAASEPLDLGARSRVLPNMPVAKVLLDVLITLPKFTVA